MGRQEPNGPRVRVVGRDDVGPRTRMWRPRRGGRYDGHPSVGFDAVSIVGMDFSGLAFSDFETEGTRFVECDFTGSTVDGTLALRRQTVFERCRFARTDLRGSPPGQARFVDCDFVDAFLTGWRSHAGEFVRCRFEGSFQGVRFWGRPWGAWTEPGNLRPTRTANEFVDNDFSRGRLVDVSFVGGIDLRRQHLPSDPMYVRLDRPAERLRRGLLEVRDWPPGTERDEALILLEAYGSDEDLAAQDELFANRTETDVDPRVAQRVWALLETYEVEG